MGHEPPSTDPVKAKPTVSHTKIRRFVFGSAVLLTVALFLGNYSLTKGFGAVGEPSASGSSLPATISVTPTPTSSPTPTPTPLPTAVPEIRVTITAVGDVIMHKAVTDGGLIHPVGDPAVYDFTPDFQYIAPIIEKSDLAMANFEGTLGGPPYTGFPYFSGPDAIADALYSAGFRVICAANNHCIDKGLDGLIRTASVFRDKGFTVIGTRPDTDTPKDTVADLDGIKIGLLNYTFETPGTSQRKSINGIPMPDGADPLISSFNPYKEPAYDKDLEAILLRVSALRQQGAETICLTLHWGEEYQTHSVAWQQKMAQQLCDAGVELIIGHHPHVLEEIDVLTSAVTGKQTLVYYSLGNFLGNWAYGTLGTSGKAEDGMIARITFLKTSAGVTIEKGEYIPTFIVRISTGSGWKHVIVPVMPALSDPAAYQTTAGEMQASYNRTHKLLSSYTGTAEIPVMEAGS